MNIKCMDIEFNSNESAIFDRSALECLYINDDQAILYETEWYIFLNCKLHWGWLILDHFLR